MPYVSFRARVFYMEQGEIGEKPAGNIAVKVFSPVRNKPPKSLWKGMTDREGRINVSFNASLSARGLDPNVARILDGQRTRQGLVAEFVQGTERVRLPIARGKEMQKFVLPWAPATRMTIHMRKVDKVNPSLKQLSKRDFSELLMNTGARITSPVPTKKGQQRQRKAEKADLKQFAERFPKKDRLLKSIRVADESANDVTKKKLKSTGKTVELIHPRALMRDMLMIDAEISDVAFQRRHHKQMFEMAEGGLKQLSGNAQRKAAQAFGKLTNPAALATGKIEDVRVAVVEISQFVIDFLDWLGGPFGRPATCGGERGTGFGGDATPASATVQPNNDGLLANNDWPLKHYTTCVRDQGGRGTCVSFGIVAAVECLIASDFGIWTNLSEQDLIYASEA